LAVLVSPAAAQQDREDRPIMPYSGQFADTATQMDNAIKLYVKGTATRSRQEDRVHPQDSGGIARTWRSASPGAGGARQGRHSRRP